MNYTSENEIITPSLSNNKTFSVRHYLRRWDIKDGKRFNAWVKRAVDAYNNRQHQSLGKRTPIEYETYIKELSADKKEKMNIFTIKREDYKNPMQLSLFPEF